MKCALNIDFNKNLIIMTRLFSQKCRDMFPADSL